jgi:hypothetical protein
VSFGGTALSVRSSGEIPIFLRAWIAAIFIGSEARTVLCGHSVVFSIVLVGLVPNPAAVTTYDDYIPVCERDSFDSAPSI